MTIRTIAVVSAGLGVPSSTRLLADRLAASVLAPSSGDGVSVAVQQVEGRGLATDVTHRLLTGLPRPGPIRSAHVRTPAP